MWPRSARAWPVPTARSDLPGHRCSTIGYARLHGTDAPRHRSRSSTTRGERARGSQSDVLKQRLGWAPLFWTILDDGKVEDCLAVIGQVDGTVEPTAGRSSRRLHCDVTTFTRHTDDGEAIAAHEGWIYVFGSGYGAKSGPLKAERSFVARFHEDDVEVDDDGNLSVDLHVQQAPFVLHHVINDALRASGLDVSPPAPKFHKKFVTNARNAAVKQERDWAWRIRHDDVPINIEGAEFTPEGTLLLGLRYPVTGEGDPIIVAVRNIDRLFDPGVGDPEAVAIFTVPASVTAARTLVFATSTSPTTACCTC